MAASPGLCCAFCIAGWACNAMDIGGAKDFRSWLKTVQSSKNRFHDKAGFGGIALDGQSPSSVGLRDTAVPLEQREIQPFRAPRPQGRSMPHKEKAQARVSG